MVKTIEEFFSHELENEKFDLLHFNEFEQNSLSRIIKEYNEKVKLTPLNKSKIPYEHEIVLKIIHKWLQKREFYRILPDKTPQDKTHQTKHPKDKTPRDKTPQDKTPQRQNTARQVTQISICFLTSPTSQ